MRPMTGKLGGNVVDASAGTATRRDFLTGIRGVEIITIWEWTGRGNRPLLGPVRLEASR